MRSKKITEEKKKEEKIAIIGLDCNIGNANSPYEFWNRIQTGSDMVGTIPHRRRKIADDILNLYEQSTLDPECVEYEEMCYLKDIDKFDYDFFHITPREASLIDPSQKLLLQSVYRCLEDSNRKVETFNGSSTGVFVGFDDGDLIRYKDIIYRAKPELYNMSIAGNHASMLAGRISDYFNLTGPTYNINTACSSSLSALHLACKSILNEECAQVIVATVNYTLVPIKAANHQLGIESKQNRTRAFDYLSDGTAKGEGVITMLLKPYSKAVSAHDPIYAVINKTAIGHDGKSSSLTSPSMLAQKRLIERAWNESGLDREELIYLEAHGTGTKIGDSIEIEALKQVLPETQERRGYCGIGSVKSNIGHLNAAAGLAGVLKVALSLYRNEIVPTIHYTFPNWNLDFVNSSLYVTKSGQKLSDEAHIMAVNSFGISGTNGHAILSNVLPPEKEQMKCDYYLLALSAESEDSLKSLMKEYLIFLSNHTDLDLFDICYTANTAREQYKFRKAFVVRDKKDLYLQLLQASVSEMKYSRSKEPLRGIDTIPIKGILLQTEKSQKEQLMELAAYYEKQGTVNWTECYAPYSFTTVHIPVYAFDKKGCWWDYGKKEQENRNPICYVPKWEERGEISNRGLIHGDCLIVKSEEQLSEQVACDLQIALKQVIPDTSNIIVLNYDQLEGREWAKDCQINIFYVATLKEELDYVRDYNSAVESGILAFQKLYLSLQTTKVKINQIVCIGNHGAIVHEKDEKGNAFNGAFYEYLKSVSAEHKGKLKILCVDIAQELERETMMGLLTANADYEKIAVRGKRCFQENYVMALGDYNEDCFADGDTYLVTGGLSENALHLCNRISKLAKVHFYFVTRNPEEHFNTDAVKNLLAILQRNGSTYAIRSCDITVEDTVKNVLEHIEIAERKKIQGIIHCAGVESHGLLKSKTVEGIRRVIEPKIKGLLYIEKYTRQSEMKFCFSFSSLASVTGTAGQGDYAYANRFMDIYSTQMSFNGKRFISLNWPAFRDAGMAHRNHVSTKDMLIEPLSFKKMSDWFVYALKKFAGQIIFSDKELYAQSQVVATDVVELKEEYIPIIEDYSDVKKVVIDTWKEVLGYSEIDEEKDFIQQGGNSISIINLATSLEAKFPIRLPEEFYDSVPTITDICKLIESQMKLKESCYEIQDIQPFNAFMFNNCFYNALFSVLQKYNISIPEFILNFEPSYVAEKEPFQIEYINTENLESLLEKYSLELQRYDPQKSLIDCLKDAIMFGDPVILGVDCYYISIRQDMYQKTHYAHSLTVFGIDEVAEEVIVLEQVNVESLSYQKRRISFEEISNAYLGYRKNFPEKELDYVALHLSEESLKKGVEKRENENRNLWNYQIILKEMESVFSVALSPQKDELAQLKILNEIINFLEICKYLACELQEGGEKQQEIAEKLRSFQKLRISMVRKKQSWEQICLEALELIH